MSGRYHFQWMLCIALVLAGCGGPYKPAALRAMREKKAKQMEGKWLTVRGPITRAKYFPDGAPMSFIQKNKSVILMQEDGKRELYFEFEGPKSSKWDIDALSRDDVVTIKGKVTLVGEHSMMFGQCSIQAGP